MKNPYSALINHMREQGGKNNTPYVQVGLVISPDPLTIKLGDLQIGKDNLLVADYLLPGYARRSKFQQLRPQEAQLRKVLRASVYPQQILTLPMDSSKTMPSP